MELEQPSGDSAAEIDSAPPIDLNDGAPSDPPDDLLEGDLQGDPQTPPDDDEEDELDGVKLRGKKEALEAIKAGRLRQDDYTRKTQEVAETRRQLEAREAQFQQTAQSHQQHIREVAQLVAIDDRLAQFEKAGINAYSINQMADSDPVQALKLHNELMDLQARRGQTVNSITQKQQAQAQESQRSNAKQLYEASQVLARDIKGWSPDLANKLSEYGKSQGYPAEVLGNVTKPEFVKTLHKAFLYDQLQKQRTAKPVTEPSKPATRLGGAGAVTNKPLSEVTDAEFIRRRREYIAKNR